MRLMIDTNVFLDVLMKREPFYENSKRVLSLCETGRVQGFLSASSATDIFYLVRKAYQSNEMAYKALGHVLDIVNVLSVSNTDVLNAYMLRVYDFEDCLLAICAESNSCDAIVTRNKKDFVSFGIELISPEELIDKYI